MPSSNQKAIDATGEREQFNIISPVLEKQTATASQVSFTTTAVPAVLVMVFRNGAALPANSISNTPPSTTVTYNPANNEASTIDSGDIIDFLIF